MSNTGPRKGPRPTPAEERSHIRPWYSPAVLWQRKTTIIAFFSVVGIAAHLMLRFAFDVARDIARIPLLVTLVVGGAPLLHDLLRKLRRREFGSDLLGGMSIITSVALGEYLASSTIVLMLAGGEPLPRSAGHRHALSVATGDSHRDHWFDFTLRPASHHR